MPLTHLTDYLMQHAQQTPGKAAIVFEGATISWKELDERVQKASTYLRANLDNTQQQIVSILLTNSPEFIVAYLGTLLAGHMALPLDPAYKKLELEAIIDQLPPKLIVTDERYHDQISGHTARTVLVDEVLRGAAESKEPLRLSAVKQVASLTFTSGTTGKPKAVPNTHANHLWNIKVCSEVWDWTSEDTLLLNLPLSHMHGIVIGLSGTLYHGNTVYLRQQSFDAKSVLQELASGKISLFTHAPIAYMKMMEVKGDYDLSRVRVMISGSAPFPPSLWDDFKERFGVEVVETYGTSETGRIAGNRLGKKVVGSPGPPFPEVKVKLSSENELLVKSPGLFPGYYQNPAATAEATTADGFWRTGDIAEIREGNIYLKGRVQERIRRFGYTVSPRDVEWALRKNPAIKDVLVMGRQRVKQPSDEIIYFVVGDITEEEVRNYCKDSLIFVWRPDRIVILKSLPRTRSGKPQLTKLRELAGISK